MSEKLTADELAAKMRDHQRKHLLARMAGNIAAGLAYQLRSIRPEPDTSDASLVRMRQHENIASDAVEIAERILARTGL